MKWFDDSQVVRILAEFSYPIEDGGVLIRVDDAMEGAR